MSIDDSDMVNQLTKLGLNQREAKAYIALLRVPEASAAELGRISGFPRTKIYEVIAQMVTKGFCFERQEGKKKFYRATRPRELGEQLQRTWTMERRDWVEKRKASEMSQRAKWEREQQAKWEKKREAWEAEGNKWEKEYANRLANSAEIFVSLDKFFMSSANSSSSLEKVETLQSKEQIHLKYDNLINQTEFECLAFARSPWAAADDMTRAKQVASQTKILERGVSMRSVYMDDPDEHSWMLGFIEKLQGPGEEVRMSKDLPMKMFVFDRKTVLIPIPSIPGLAGADFTMLCVQDHGFVRGCCMLFESVWEKSIPYDRWLKNRELNNGLDRS